MEPGGACRICRSVQARSPCCWGGLPRRRSPRRPVRDTDGADLISALPDDLLLLILARLRCARAAAHTSLLARRWRGLWARLPELAFHYIEPDQLDAALASVDANACPAVPLLDISSVCGHRGIARIASLLRAAARLAPAELNVRLLGEVPLGRDAVELPCFHRATSIRLDMQYVRFVLPPTGTFAALEFLHLRSCQIDLPDLLPRCRSLRKLWIYLWPHHSFVVNSPTLEDLVLNTVALCRRVEIVAPMLKKLSFFANSYMDPEFTLSCSAPVVEEFSWCCPSPSSTVVIGQVWWLPSLALATPRPLGPRHLASENTCLQLQQRREFFTVAFPVVTHVDMLGDADQSIVKQLFKFVIANFEIMALVIEARGHAYGGMLLHLLEFCTFIQRLEVKLQKEGEKECSINCPCDQPSCWRSQSISLTNLKEVEIEGFKGEDHEIDLLKVIFRSATLLQRLIVIWSDKVSPTGNECMGIHSILKAYPSVKCNFYFKSGEQVLYA